VFYFVAFEKNDPAAFWKYRLHAIGQVQHQFASIPGFPIFVQVAHYGKLAALVLLELIEVTAVKTARFVECIVEFVAFDAGKTSAVEVLHKIVNGLQELALPGIVAVLVQPADEVAPHLQDFLKRKLFADASPVFHQKNGLRC
jgi:hypothetical protein